ncbi:LacI family DNA-binding transcriptional regulator [Coraliomargarita parva]|uniref:LacI family DNA-binding transcriptional regulator n=1 Tax=Coraliomargarita parva TaxID=3014050 RepID=UPI0022B31275|nr:LacI family DNA-binding transcriptional regulator [Coraliomargarita parva]
MNCVANRSEMFSVTFVPKKTSNSDKRPTIYDVATLAGVSHMTVSRVLNGKQVVRPATVAKVEAAVNALGYRPDPVLSALAAYRSTSHPASSLSNLAFLDRDQTEYSAVVYEGVKAEAILNGYSVERHVLMHDLKQQLQLARMLYNRGVRGLLFGPSFEEWKFSDWDWSRFAMVSLGAVMHEPHMDSVCMNYFEGAFQACQILRERGCYRIGFAVNPFIEKRTGHRWLGGYAAAVGLRNQVVLDGAWPTNESDFSAWCDANQLDGVLVANESLLSYWHGNPRHFVMLNHVNQFNDSTIMRIHLDPKQIGAEGVRLLHQSILRNELGLSKKPKKIALEGTWL